MSNIASLLLYFIIYLSMHACNGRHLRLMEKDQSIGGTQSYNFFPNNKDFEKSIDDRDKKAMMIFTSNRREQEKDQRREHEELLGGNSTKDSSNSKQSKLKNDDMEESNKSILGVSSGLIHVPDHDRSSMQTGFNLDYSLPMTHPPSHN